MAKRSTKKRVAVMQSTYYYNGCGSPSYYPQIHVTGRKLNCIKVGCREFVSFKQAFDYLAGMMSYPIWRKFNGYALSDWRRFEYNSRADYDTGLYGEYVFYQSEHCRDLSSYRGPEISALWEMQSALVGKINFKPYQPKWLRESLYNNAITVRARD
jgi:hypothetical protein